MKLLVLSTLLAVVAADFWSFIPESKETCSYNVLDFCNRTNAITQGSSLSRCNTKLGISKCNDITDIITAYTNLHIKSSFEYLLLATHFGGHRYLRPGFETIFRKLSASTWEDAIKLIQYVSERGGIAKIDVPIVEVNFTLNEISSIAKAIDIQKKLAQEAKNIHAKVSMSSSGTNNIRAKLEARNNYDPDLASFLEKDFLRQQFASLRQLSGHMTDLSNLLMQDSTKSVAVFLFDEYLQGQ